MAQTREGAIKVAAEKANTTPERYVARMVAGEKWCTVCRQWHPVGEFGKDSSRWDGLAAGCRRGRGAKARARYVPKPGAQPGRSFVPPRDGDARQARRRVNYFVEAGLLPHPNSLPCADCGHEWRPRGWRHEYDHFRGYSAEHHEVVEAVCSRCHHRREKERALGHK